MRTTLAIGATSTDVMRGEMTTHDDGRVAAQEMVVATMIMKDGDMTTGEEILTRPIDMMDETDIAVREAAAAVVDTRMTIRLRF